ncbi:MAG: hypothetical protein PVSMB11_02240 [Desulfuromonadaceae bacterium]
MKRIALMLAGSSVLLQVLSGCGSGGGGTTRLQQKTATITFSTVSSAHTAPLQGIQLTTRLPAGASVSDISTALIGRNDTGQIGQRTYTPNPPVVSFIVSSISAPIKFGTFTELTCDIAPGSTLDQSSFSVAKSDIQMTGKDSSGTTVNLVDQIMVKISVSFGY